ncbi:XRE family transcriptional regulator [Myceligenerans halotolerans]
MAELRNGRLVAAIRQAGISRTRLAAEVGVDPKTVERWITGGRTPHPRHREAAAAVLEQPASFLWDVPDETRDGVPAEVVAIYPSRRNVPYATWQSLVSRVTDRFELHALAAMFLPDQTMDLASELIRLAGQDVRIRLLLGDPDGQAVARRDEEEGRVGVDGRVRLVLGYVAPVISDPRIEVRLHDTTLYVSTYRFDDDLLVNQHVWGHARRGEPADAPARCGHLPADRGLPAGL